MKLSGDHQGRGVSPFLEFLIKPGVKRKDVNSTSQKSDPCMTTNCYYCIDTYAGEIKEPTSRNRNKLHVLNKCDHQETWSGTF